MLGDAEIIGNRQVRPEADILKGAGNAQGGNPVRAESRHFFPLDLNFSLNGPINSANKIKDRGLAGPVGTDQTDQFPPFKPEVEVRYGL